MRSVTGYWVRLPIEDLDSLLLATGPAGPTWTGATATRYGWSPQPARLLVGQVGHRGRAEHDAVVVAAAVPDT